MSNGAAAIDLESRVGRLERQAAADSAELLAELRDLRATYQRNHDALAVELRRLYDLLVLGRAPGP